MKSRQNERQRLDEIGRENAPKRPVKGTEFGRFSVIIRGCGSRLKRGRPLREEGAENAGKGVPAAAFGKAFVPRGVHKNIFRFKGRNNGVGALQEDRDAVLIGK